MSKSVPALFQLHLNGEYLTLATLWDLTSADGSRSLHFTDHDANIPQGGNTYKAASGYTRSALSGRIELNVDNTDVDILLDDVELDAVDIRNGVWDDAIITMKLVNYTKPTDGIIFIRRGTIGEIRMLDSQQATAELRGLTQKLSISLADIYAPDCRADLGDAVINVNGTCFIILDPNYWIPNEFHGQRDLHEADKEGDDAIVKPTRFNDRNFISFELIGTETSGATEPAWNLTIGGDTIDGDVKWVTFRARTIEGVVASVSTLREFTITYIGDAPDAYLLEGVFTAISGPNAGAKKEVKSWTLSTKTVKLKLPLAVAMEVGDKITISAGCDKSVPECRDTFDNMFNYNGEPYVPGTNVTLNFPDAR